MKQFESFRLDTANGCLWRDGVQIALPPRPFMVLQYLVNNPGRLISHDELLDALWPETFVQPQVLRTYVLELRKLLGDDVAQPRFIQTLPKRGYCFVASVSECSENDRGVQRESLPHYTDLRGVAGRDEELARLEALLRQAVAGHRQVAFLAGEAGIGKTALLDAFLDRVASTRPIAVARGQCVQGFGEKEEYYPVMEALAQLCASSAGEEARRILARLAPAWLAAPGREPEPAPAPSSVPERMPGDLCAALEEIAAKNALLLLFEDLHWADGSTLNLVSALARRRTPAKLMIVATCGNGDTAPDHPLRRMKHDLLLRQLCTEVALAPLNQTAVSQLLSRELKQDPLPPGLTAFVHQHSESNPLFVIAILEHLIARRCLVRDGPEDASRWVARAPFEELDADVPDRLAQMIELEIECLTPDEQRILGAGSVMGIAFPAWAVAAALEQNTAEIEEACDQLARRLHFVERAGQDELPDGTRSEFFVFVHGLYREVLYQRQPAARRARCHLRIARRLGELFAGCESAVAREMAMHYEAAADWQGAASALRIASGHARRRQAHAEATQLLEHALRIAERLSDKDRDSALQAIRNELATAHEPASAAAPRRQKTPRKNLTLSG
jgi:predicted ATPase/DNA-binding winged helix-turn-helix (wHTH) protein